MTEYYFISDNYCGEKFNDDNYVTNFVNRLNGIKLGGTISKEKSMHVLFCVNEIINFEYKYSNDIPKIGDVIKIECREIYNNGEYYKINDHPFDTDISVLCSKECYERKNAECKFDDLIKMLYKLEIDIK
jgi:hypothetical protein